MTTKDKLFFLLNKQAIIFFVLGLLIVATLINNNTFESIVSSAYYYYLIIATIIICITGVIWIKNKNFIQISIPTPILFFIAIPAYYLLQMFLNKGDWRDLPQYYIINALLLFSCYSILSIYTIQQHRLYKVIIIIACLESMYCLFQFFGWLKSDTPSFKITGTWINPNITAIFIAMAWPTVLYLYAQSIKKKRKIIFTAVFILIALILLKCRTAFIGLTVSTVIILNYRYRFIESLRQKFSGYKIFLPLLSSLIFILFVVFYLVQTKKDSTNGRVFIWKIGLNMITQKPILGWGYDKFTREYNYAQADYFKSGNGTSQEIENASFVRTTYNELFHNAIEGGVIAVFILLFFFGSLLFTYKRCKNLESITAYAATTSFIVMSLFNFAFFALPAMSLFIVYTAILTFHTKKYTSKKSQYNFFIAIALVALSIYFLFTVTTNAFASAKTKKASVLASVGKNNEANLIFEALYKKRYKSNEYLKSYGNTLLNQKKYADAIDKYKQVIIEAPDPDVLLKLGFCYQQTKQYNKAIEVCTLAHNIVPNRVLPLFSQMSVYLYANDTISAIKMAKQVVEIIPKIASKETSFYKQQAGILLNKLILKH